MRTGTVLHHMVATASVSSVSSLGCADDTLFANVVSIRDSPIDALLEHAYFNNFPLMHASCPLRLRDR